MLAGVDDEEVGEADDAQAAATRTTISTAVAVLAIERRGGQFIRPVSRSTYVCVVGERPLPLLCVVMTTLWLDFAGVGYQVSDRLGFGRSADLALDESNKFMHRVAGEFRLAGSVWWLDNVGSSTRLLVFGANGARIELPPGTDCALPMPSGSVSFVAGPTPYQLLYRADEPVVSSRPIDAIGDATVEFGTALTDRETIYLTTFALKRLRGTSAGLLSYAEVAELWSVSEKTVDNTLQRIRGRLKDAGVRNTETLEGLVNHLLAQGRIGLATLVAIEAEHPGVLPE